jgi:Uri superfamily endonuclease
VPGAQGVIYDTALRGVHHQTLLRDLVLLPVNRVTAAVKGSKKPRRKEGRRVEKSVHIEEKIITLRDGTTKHVSLFARGGAIGIVELSDNGDPVFTELRRVRTHRNRDKSGRFRWYNDYLLPAELGGGTVTIRLHGNSEDAARKLNRTENVRPIPPSDPDFKALYARRNDAESINRGINDSMWLARAHSVGHLRQQVNLIGYALMVNSLALYEHERTQTSLAA